MRKFFTVEQMRKRWTDGSHTKNHPKQCAKDHNFCHIDYQWAHDNHADRAPLNQSLPNIALPTAEDERATVTLDMMTEESLDDWIAQSINRSIPSMLNPQKKFYLPLPLENQLRARYRRKITSKQYQDETYFRIQKRPKKVVGYLANEASKNKPAINQLYIDYHQLQPKVILGTPLKSAKIDQKPKNGVRRRNAVLLQNDIHYNRLLKQLKRSSNKVVQEKQPVRESPKPTFQNKQMIYSFNVDSMRRSSCEQDVPNSIIQKEFSRIREPQKDFLTVNRHHLREQEEIQQKIRAAINQKASNAILKIDSLVGKKEPTSYVTQPPVIKRQTLLKKNSTAATRQLKELSVSDKKLQEKVMKLVNNMQVISQHIDVEMSKLDIHLSEVYLQHPSNKIQNKWVLKAEEKIKEKQYVLAIDCYKQALIIQPDFFIPIFNIAVLLQKQKMLSYAKNWFQLAKQFETDTENVSYGLALVQVKQLQFEKGLKEIDQLIQRLQTGRKKVQMAYYYLRALCYKQLSQFEKAKLDYEIIIKNSKPANYHSLSYFLLSVVFAKMRRYTPQFNCLAYINWRETLSLLFYEKNKKVKEDNMNDTDLADKLIKQPFFCRFAKNLVKKLLAISRYETLKKESILFSSESESLIIVNGLVEIWSHQQSITCPNTISVLGQGGIIGGGQIDHNLSSRPNYWFLAKTDLQIIRVSRKQFNVFWQGQITFEFDYKYNFLKNVGLFKDLPEASLFKLCEAVQIKTYEKDWILFNDCSYRQQLLSQQGLGFCLGKQNNTDPRFVNSKKASKAEDILGRRKVKARLALLIKKYIFKFNEMKFNRLRYPGLFILKEGKIEIEDDRGFRCRDIMSPRDYFGENLLIHSQGFQNYGRMVVSSPTATFYLLNTNKLLWAFTSLDKQTMAINAKERPEIETLRFLRNRFGECLQVKMSKLLAKKE